SRAGPTHPGPRAAVPPSSEPPAPRSARAATAPDRTAPAYRTDRTAPPDIASTSSPTAGHKGSIQADQKRPDARRRRATTEAWPGHAAGRREEATTQMAVFHRPTKAFGWRSPRRGRANA